MYVKQKYKFIFSFIFIFIFMFFAFTVPYLETTVNAEAVTLTVGAVYAVIGAITAGVVFTDPQGVIDHSRAMTDKLLPFPQKEYDQMHREIEEKMREWRKDWEDGKPPPKPPIPPKPPKPLKPGGRFIPIILGAQLPGLGKGNLDYWRNKKENEGMVDTITNIITSRGSYVITPVRSSDHIMLIVKHPDGRFNGVIGVSSGDPKQIKKHTIEYEYKFVNNYLYVKPIVVVKQEDGNLIKRDNQPFIKTAYVGSDVTTSSHKEQEDSIVGAKLPSSFPEEIKELDDFKYPIPFPQIPQIPNPDWSDYGLGTETVTIPQPGVSPDISSSPAGVPIQIPTKYPSDIDIFELDSGMKPDDFVNMNQSQLNQYLQENIYNNTTNNNTTIINPGTPIEDGPFDIVDFDFTPLKDIGTSLVTRFPFCIPFDLIEAIKVIAGNSVPPNFNIKIRTKDPIRKVYYEYSQTINFKMFETFALISRVFTTLIFVVALMFATSKMIKW